MSMVGVKDVSVIYEPPSNRSPVQTYVFEYDRGIIREAITRELERNGQVYYLYNRVEDIERVAFLISEEITWARVAFAHGKMSPTELENIMLNFAEHEYDVLVCTTIIDSGVDIPNVNTIIVENAENLGLSQLYQLRGRVGRADRIAYAYITYRRNKVLSEIATKRLNAIREFTEFGSGFKIAMRDLEIRGAGNLIGAEQHGHMDAVGYETYCKILEAMIKELKGEAPVVEEEEEVLVDLSVNAYIPEKYIRSEVQKMEMYQKISKISDEEMLSDMIDELTDRYGDVPKETMRLLTIVELKCLAKAVQVVEIIGKNSYKGTFSNDSETKVQLTFHKNAQIDMESLSALVKKFRKGRMLFSAGETPYLTFYCDGSEDELLKNVKFVLQNINLLKKE
jgi:transcription-repair coupling factor (superfamily II helicase)